ncbi:molybdate transport system substrate-binding protein [Nocardioides marinisabuli]|uniref:Molybdate transport system substrate-binding protein n=1 Tax=Nocardioides marinisabuli TaxID=419476 RepID=A0A7Y9JQB5_9ACTN|nr:molybdate ABC transporter substrate-binding protein [Nocardioides marinisabuli]NYD57892.1 molybdate transport system substrate-binding protein [Nocardioides marinisabuli]
MRARAAATLLTLLAVTGCSAGGGAADDGSEPAPDDTLTVLAAASLTETFTTLAEEFEAEHPGVEVSLAFDSSATLAQQALEGAPADLLATADTRTIESAADALAAAPEIFATNTLVLVVPAGNPGGVTSVDDLVDGGYVACVETAPCGATWAALAADNGIDADPASLEVDVKAVLARVVADEVDAGIVYATDAVAAGDAVETIELPGAEQQVTSYPIAVLAQSSRPDLAQELADLVLGETGRQVLADAGFGVP